MHSGFGVGSVDWEPQCQNAGRGVIQPRDGKERRGCGPPVSVQQLSSHKKVLWVGANVQEELHLLLCAPGTHKVRAKSGRALIGDNTCDVLAHRSIDPNRVCACGVDAIQEI